MMASPISAVLIGVVSSAAMSRVRAPEARVRVTAEFQQVGGLAEAEGIAQAHGKRADHGDRVRVALAGDVGGRAVDRLVEGLAAALGVDGAQRGGGQHAERAGEHRRHVREHVAEQVVGDEDVVLLRAADQLHGAVVGEHVLQADVAVLGVDLGHDLLPEDAGLHDVVLLGRGDPARALAGEVEGHVGDPLDLGRGVDLGVDGALRAVRQGGDLLRLAEIDAAGELAHDHDVEALDQLALQGRGVGEGRVADRRAQVGEEAEILAQAQEARLGADLVSDIRPFRAAHRAEQDRVGGIGPRQGRVGERLAMGVDGAAADEVALDLEAGETRARPGHRSPSRLLPSPRGRCRRRARRRSL